MTAIENRPTIAPHVICQGDYPLMQLRSPNRFAKLLARICFCRTASRRFFILAQSAQFDTNPSRPLNCSKAKSRCHSIVN